MNVVLRLEQKFDERLAKLDRRFEKIDELDRGSAARCCARHGTTLYLRAIHHAFSEVD